MDDTRETVAFVANRGGRPIRVGQLDALRLSREGFRCLLAHGPDLQLAWEAEIPAEAYERMQGDPVDVLVMSLLLRGGHGFLVLREILRRSPDCRVLVLSQHTNRSLALQAQQLGARAYGSKETASTRILDGIRKLGRGAQGFLFLDDEGSVAAPAAPPGDADPLWRLTPRERQVFHLLVHELSNEQVASALGISPRTLETHRARVFRKLHLSSFGALLRFAVRIGQAIE